MKAQSNHILQSKKIWIPNFKDLQAGIKKIFQVSYCSGKDVITCRINIKINLDQLYYSYFKHS
jgi:hypothetical protein